MYKIINILLFIGVLNTSLFAETTKEDVERYFEVSRGGEIVKHNFLSRYKRYFSIIYGMDIKKSDKNTIEKYEAFILNPKYMDDFYNILGQLDDNTFFEIMAFYKTKLGQKYVQAFQKLYNDGTYEWLMVLIEKEKGKPILPTKRKLVTEINKALHSRYYIDLEKHTFTLGHGVTIIEDNISSNITIDKVMLNEHFEVFSELAYAYFTDEELSQILEYAKTYGKIEMGFLDYALRLNIEHFKKDLHDFMEKEKITQKVIDNSGPK